jgi:phosphoribosylamine--glycine ligase
MRREPSPMKILIIGSGGREHAIAWKVAQSPLAEKVYAAPGNAGIADCAECVPLGAERVEDLLAFALEKRIDLTVVGPEAPLVAGIVDRFSSRGLRIFGFGKDGAKLEGSKIWAKEFMRRHGIPTGDFAVFDHPEAAGAAVERAAPPFVIKADGLAAGKGVFIARTREEAREAIELVMVRREFGEAGARLVIEEFLTGAEASILSMFDGSTYRLFAPSQDHKRALDGDRGPNTGGMGAYAPVPALSPALQERIRTEIVEPTFAGMRKEGIAGAGVLYFGLMLTEEGPKVLEYNCRFGDPETQVILSLFEGDLVETIVAATEGSLAGRPFSNASGAAACVVIASGGYPGSCQKGFTVTGLDEAARRGCIVFHAGTALREGTVVTAGGRVFGVTAVGTDLREAIRRAYRGVEAIQFEGAFSRRDIGMRALEETGGKEHS